MMLVTVFADELKEFLEVWQFNHTVTAKRVEFFVGESAFSKVGGHFAAQVISGDAAVREWPGRNTTDDCPVRVFFANGARDDFLVIHFLLAEKGLGQIRTVE